MGTFRSAKACSAVAACVLALAGCATREPERLTGDERRAHDLLNRATITLATFGEDPDHPEVRDALRGACAVLVFPAMTNVSFIVGGGAGRGVLLVRDASDAHWGGPAFYALDQLNLGVQLGAARRELVVVMHRCDGLAPLYAGKTVVRWGTTLSLEVVDQGQGLEVARDIKAFSRANGLYVGAAVNGTMFHVDTNLAAAYYGKEMAPAEILARDAGDDPAVREIRNAVEIATR